MSHIAHIRQSDDVKQTVAEHLLACKELSEGYGNSVGLKHLAGLGGLLHDVGKYSDEFLNYLTTAVYDPENARRRGSVDHSTAGGKLLFDRYHATKSNAAFKLVAEVVGNAIISHHSSLKDFVSDNLESPYIKRVKQTDVAEYTQIKSLFFKEVMSETDFDLYVSQAAKELVLHLKETTKTEVSKKLYFLTRMLFSFLVDADRTNTRQFEENRVESKVDSKNLFNNYAEKLEAKLESFKQLGQVTTINKLRAEMSQTCLEAASRPSDIYSLSIPTGGGKTLASLRYALHHALIHNKKRIIYIVPFTTIIEQNAFEVRKILQDSTNIIEHHSNVIDTSFAEIDDEGAEGTLSIQEKVKLARDNWDAPVIFTTMVQFLEACYGHGSRVARRMHNLSEAILIFDEVQKVPTTSVALFNQAVNFLTQVGKSSVLLCTATQPALDFVKESLIVKKENELVSNLSDVERAFKRTEIVDRTREGPINTEDLTDFSLKKVDEETSVLVILNTKPVVKKLYLALKDKNPKAEIYHLSTSMCAAHRKSVLEKIRKKLNEGTPIICVTTQLIEAGVDVDFGCVIRSLAGLDSIAQAAGRCNRHGKHQIKPVYIIEHSEENVGRLDDIQEGRHITKKLLRLMEKDEKVFHGDILSSKAMEQYFKEFYQVQETKLTYPIDSLGTSIVNLLFDNTKTHPFVLPMYSKTGQKPSTIMVNSFSLASKKYNVIDSITTSVIVEYGEEGKEIVADLNGAARIEDLSKLLKKAQQYSVNIFEHEKRELEKAGLLVSYLEGLVYSVVQHAYDEEFGLDTSGQGQSNQAMFF